MNPDPATQLHRLQVLCLELINAWEHEPTAGHFIDAITISPDPENDNLCLLGRIEAELPPRPTATPTDG